MYTRGDHCLRDRVCGRVPWRNVPRLPSSKSLSTHACIRSFVLTGAMGFVSVPAVAQDESRAFAGALFGVSALSADAQAVTSGADAAVSLYDPKNGSALNVFGGIHVAQYFAIQVNWMWNRNDLTLVSSYTSPEAGGFYEQARDSTQHAMVFDGLIYFRRLDSSIRPYLGTGLSVVHFSSDEGNSRAQGLSPPAGAIRSTRIGLRSHVGIDFRLSRHVAFRYSFSETISSNPISPSLTPPGRRPLMNFQNLFGFVSRF
jgi:outer membrane protein with beta-barrel domain